MAISCARRILVMVSGHQAPAFTVASLATTTAGRPSMRAEAGDDAGGGRLAVVAVVGDQQADFEEAAAGVDQLPDALARRQLAGAVLLVDARRSAARAEALFERVNLLDQVAHVRDACKLGSGVGWRIHGLRY